jgi:hypothetical protein
VEFLAQKYGLDTVKQILTDLGAGRDVNDAIAAHSLPLPKLEKEFATFARERADQLAPGVDLEKPPQNEDQRRLWDEDKPKNYYVRMEKARDLIAAKKWGEARDLAESIAAGYHGEHGAANPLWLEAEAERNLNDTNAERATLEKFAAQEADFVDLDARLMELAGARKDWKAETDWAGRWL